MSDDYSDEIPLPGPYENLQYPGLAEHNARVKSQLESERNDITPSEEPRTLSLGWMTIAKAVDDHLSKQEDEIEKLRAALIEINDINSKRINYSKKIDKIIWEALGEKE